MIKKILAIFFLAVILIFLTYKKIYKNDYYYLALGDDIAAGKTPYNAYSSSYVDYLYDDLNSNKKVYLNKEHISKDKRIKDLINMSPTLMQDIKKADLITISIGSEELFSKLRSVYDINNNDELYSYVDALFLDMDSLFNKIRKLNKNKIVVIGLYNPIKVTSENEKTIRTLFDYIDGLFYDIAYKYNLSYIEINNAFIENNYKYLPNINNAFPSEEGQYYIYEQIKKES